MKALLYILGSLAVVTGGFFAYRRFVAPSFHIERYDFLKNKGVFVFGGNENTFSSQSGGTASAYGGWALKYGTKDGKTYTFDLYRNGVPQGRVHSIDLTHP